MASNNDPINKWENTVQDQAQKDLDKFQDSQNTTNRVLEQARYERQRDNETQNNNVTYDDNSTYQDR